MAHPRRTAIVIEDSVEAADVVRMHLDDIGFRTRHLLDPADLAGARCADTEVLLLDLALGATDGVAVMRAHRDELAGLPILLMSAHSTQVQGAAVRVGRELGLDVRGFLPKPFARSLFQSSIAAALAPEPEPAPRPREAAADVDALLAAHDLALHYAPRFELVGARLLGFEARGVASGGAAPIALDGLLTRAAAASPRARLHDRLVEVLLRDLASWQRWGPLTGWLPLPATRLADTRLAEGFAAACESAGVGPERLRLLVDEEQLALRFAALIGPLSRIAMKGFEVALDDFGAGLSILSRLHCIPCAEIRLARALSDGLQQSGRGVVLVAKCVELAHELDREVAVRGISSRPQLERLRSMGCDHGDGDVLPAAIVDADGARSLCDAMRTGRRHPAARRRRRNAMQP